MTTEVYIDGIDIYTRFGLYIADGSYANMIEWPSLKDVEVTDWHEENGVEPDLDAPVLASREFTLRFNGATMRTKVESFTTLLRTKVYHDLVLSIGRSYKVRFVSAEPPQWTEDLCAISIKFADDFPLRDYRYLNPYSTITPSLDYSLDNNSLSTYGVIVLEGTRAQLEQTADVKPNLTRDTLTTSGVTYDDVGRAVVNAYKPRVSCLMRAQTLDELWRNYDALLYDLVRPGERTLTSTTAGKRYTFYYDACNVRRFFPDGKIWLEFDIIINVFKLPDVFATPIDE